MAAVTVHKYGIVIPICFFISLAPLAISISQAVSFISELLLFSRNVGLEITHNAAILIIIISVAVVFHVTYNNTGFCLA